MITRIFLLLAVTFNVSAFAEVLIEPYAGYHMGSWESGATDKDLKGLTYGARLGYQAAGFMIGVDYMTGSWEDNSSPSKNDVTPADLGIFVGYNFPVLVRIYGVLNPDPLNPSLKFKNNGTLKYEGSTYKLGIGFNIVPLVSLNFEMINGTYDEANGVNLNTNLKTSLYGLTVSIPITL